MIAIKPVDIYRHFLNGKLFIDGRMVIDNPDATTGSLLTQYSFNDAEAEFSQEVLGAEIEKLTFVIKNQTGARITKILNDNRHYKIETEPVKVGRSLNPHNPKIIIYQIIKCFLADPLEAVPDDYVDLTGRGVDHTQDTCTLAIFPKIDYSVLVEPGMLKYTPYYFAKDAIGWRLAHKG